MPLRQPEQPQIESPDSQADSTHVVPPSPHGSQHLVPVSAPEEPDLSAVPQSQMPKVSRTEEPVKATEEPAKAQVPKCYPTRVRTCMGINMALKQGTFSFIFDCLKMILLVLLLPLGSVVTAFKCNFDTSMCGFAQDSNDKFDWTRRKGSTPSRATGPSVDHTTGNGYYMYIETSSPRQQGDNAKLISPMLQFSGSMCLKFYYHMYGADIATLNVIINGNNVFTVAKSGY
ncbi:MAM domain-containing protein 2-like [Orbicella faveolata]|uniref:MAM domain-containing protein 2-like n=1 Tax=Orbicella faveolata TaxID=48498 RepID=UPI0009E208CB|nr:MAM domain-containing protein 2-like [Orbicella faveolata]